MLTQVEIAEHLDMSVRNCRTLLRKLSDKHGLEQNFWAESTLTYIRVLYIKDLRETAAGRGGAENQASMAAAKTAEAVAKTALTRIAYHREIGNLIESKEAAAVIDDWCAYANREYGGCTVKLIGEVQSAHKIEIDETLVNNVVGPAIERVSAYAGKLGERLRSRVDDVLCAQVHADGGMD